MLRIPGWVLVLGVGFLTACEEPGEKTLGLDATGTIRVAAFLDRDGDQLLSNADVPYRGLRVNLVRTTGGPVVASALTDSTGFLNLSGLPVGSYSIVPDPGSVRDTVNIGRVIYQVLPGQRDSSRLTVIPNDTANALVTISYATRTAAQAALLPRGSRVVMLLTSLNAYPTFGDSTLHLADSTGAIRAVEVRPVNVAAGDRVRILATVTERDGHPALNNLTFITAQTGELPAPIAQTTAQAASPAVNLRSNQVRITNAIVLDASTLPGGDVLFRVDDRSGPLDVLIDANAGIATALPISRGAEMDISGVLVPRTDGIIGWRLKPRRSSDLVVRYPATSIALAKSRQIGQLVSIQGITVNDINTFGDNTLHVTDSSASIRVFARPAFISAGDSISVLGTLGVRDFQPVLLDATVSVLGRHPVPAPRAVTTARAANADGGKLDAALVRIVSASVSDTLRIGADVRLTVNDSTGPVEIILDSDWALGFATPVIGSKVDVTGVLVPLVNRTFSIKPRSAADITVYPPKAPTASTNWSGYALGVQPAGWSQMWDPTPHFLVQADPVTGKNVLRWSANNESRDRWGLANDGLGVVADQEVYTEFRVRSLGVGTVYYMGSAAVRMGGTATNENGYAVFFVANGATNSLAMSTWTNGDYTQLATNPLNWARDTWYSVRLQAVGASIRSRVWARGTPEPTTWMMTATHTLYATGKMGVSHHDNGVVEWDMWFGDVIPTAQRLDATPKALIDSSKPAERSIPPATKRGDAAQARYAQPLAPRRPK